MLGATPGGVYSLRPQDTAHAALVAMASAARNADTRAVHGVEAGNMRPAARASRPTPAQQASCTGRACR